MLVSRRKQLKQRYDPVYRFPLTGSIKRRRSNGPHAHGRKIIITWRLRTHAESKVTAAGSLISTLIPLYIASVCAQWTRVHILYECVRVYACVCTCISVRVAWHRMTKSDGGGNTSTYLCSLCCSTHRPNGGRAGGRAVNNKQRCACITFRLKTHEKRTASRQSLHGNPPPRARYIHVRKRRV